MLRHLVVPFGIASLLGCQTIQQFDTTNGAAYCGSVVGGQFILTPDTEGGFAHDLRMRVEIDTANLTTVPGHLTTDDVAGPCAPQPTFSHAALRVTKEMVPDSISTMSFEDGQVHNILAWVDSTCRGTMYSVTSLYKNDHVEVRLMKPAGAAVNGVPQGDAFALFSLDRNDDGCGY